MTTAEAVTTIETLYPPDSKIKEVGEVGRALLVETGILTEYAANDPQIFNYWRMMEAPELEKLALANVAYWEAVENSILSRGGVAV